MGCSENVICRKCGHKYQIHTGGGFEFELLRCDSCGEYISIGRDEIEKAMGESSQESMTAIQQERIIAEKLAGNCKCGGKFAFDAKPRCPICKSASYKKDKNAGFAMYD